MRQVDLVNRYVLDPAHIAPSRSDANSNGHFPINNHLPAGTPRGFNLANMPFNFQSMPQGLPNPAALQAFFGPQGITPGNWSSALGGDDERHQAGPMRRQGMRFNNRTGGPYDRQPKDSRNARWNGSGRLTPPRGGIGRLPGARFVEGGAATVGPREAVQGRSLRSYEDLDAVGASGNGELNY